MTRFARTPPLANSFLTFRFGPALARLWPGFGLALARLWPAFGTALARLWPGFGPNKNS